LYGYTINFPRGLNRGKTRKRLAGNVAGYRKGKKDTFPGSIRLIADF
jgi:hypothetical protein